MLTQVLSKPNYLIPDQVVIQVYPDVRTLHTSFFFFFALGGATEKYLVNLVSYQVRDLMGSWIVKYVDSQGLGAFSANYSGVIAFVENGGANATDPFATVTSTPPSSATGTGTSSTATSLAPSQTGSASDATKRSGVQRDLVVLSAGVLLFANVFRS
jgi:hypothetical protein